MIDILLWLFAVSQILLVGIFALRWWRRRPQGSPPLVPGAIDEGYVVKGGRNDLSRWEPFGGTLKRPPPPAPIPATRPTSCCPECGRRLTPFDGAR